MTAAQFNALKRGDKVIHVDFANEHEFFRVSSIRNRRGKRYVRILAPNRVIGRVLSCEVKFSHLIEMFYENS